MNKTISNVYDIKIKDFDQQKPKIMNQKNRPSASTPQTDSESSSEGLDKTQDGEKSIYALKSLYERGLIDEADYKARLSELQDN